MRAWRSATSTRSTTPGTAICAATARCRMPASASASSAHSPTSPASPTCATRSPSREPPATRGIDVYDHPDPHFCPANLTGGNQLYWFDCSPRVGENGHLLRQPGDAQPCGRASALNLLASVGIVYPRPYHALRLPNIDSL